MIALLIALCWQPYLDPQIPVTYTADAKWEWNALQHEWKLAHTDSCADAGGGFKVCVDIDEDDKPFHVNPNWNWI
jgi:hypothetical protein